MFYGNIVSMGFAFAVSVTGILIVIFGKKEKLQIFVGPRRITAAEIIFMICAVGITLTLMYGTFFVRDGRLYVGVSVFSDFSPHIGMIRSFSLGNNFPTTYSHFAGVDIRYHFMFQFMVGNLEFLGMRLDHAFNVPSALSFIFAIFLLYALAMRLTGKKAAGVLSVVFFLFRSSPSLLTYMGSLEKNTVYKTLVQNSAFIGYTVHEDWGLWNLNVYCNQRHLASGICILLLLIHLFLDNLFDMTKRWAAFSEEHKRRVNERRLAEEERRLEEYEAMRAEAEENGEEEPEPYKPLRESKLEAAFDNIGSFIAMSFFTKEGWVPKRWLTAVGAGLLLGASAFLNGAAVLTTIMVMFVFAAAADRRLEFLITAVIATALSKLQTWFFAPTAEVVKPKLQYGFIAENPSLFGTFDYVMRLCGILIPVLFVAFVFVKGIKKWIFLAFSIPFLFAFYVSLTADVTVNHKYIMLSIMLMNIFAAWLVTRLLEHKSGWLKMLAAVIIVLMTMTGIYDYFTVLKKNTPNGGCLTYGLEDPLVDWISQNTTSQDIFLTSHYSLSRPVLGGAMLFEGHAYYPMTLGYDTNLRYKLTKEMFQSTDRNELIRLIRENLITYVIIDNDARTSFDFNLNEDIFRQTFECVYREGEGLWETDIYDTSKLLTE